MSAWQLVHIYIPAPYNSAGMAASVQRTVLPHLFDESSLEALLERGTVSEVSRHRDGHRRFQIHLVDQKQYTPIPVTFLLKYNGIFVR